MVCDWIQYKANFSDTVMVRPVIAADAAAPAAPTEPVVDGYELAVDLRRCAQPETDVAAEVTAALADACASGGRHRRPWRRRRGPGLAGAWVPGSASCVWRFNALYWQALAAWEKTTGKEYEQALPGGESDARNSAAARELILDLFSRSGTSWRPRRALPEELYVIELGVGNGGQARTWLDEFVELDRGTAGTTTGGCTT